MRDQEKRPGELLKQLRETLGYNLEDWATIFDTEAVIVEAIESGGEIPHDFLTGLLQWLLEGLKHPQNPTHIFPDGWEEDLPHAIETLLDAIKRKDALLKDLQEACDIQKQIIDYNKEQSKENQERMLGYLETITQKNDQIKTLEEVQKTEQKIDKKIIHLTVINKVTLIVFFVLLASGILFYQVDQAKPMYPIAQRVKPMVWDDGALTIKLPVLKRNQKTEASVAFLEPQPKTVKTLTHKNALKPSPAKSSQILSKKVDLTTTKPIGLNKDLANLLANNTERNNHLVEKYSSPEGKTILRFNNPDQKRMVIVINNHRQEEIHRDTIKTKHHLLDTEKFTPGVYNYWIYFGQDKNYTHTGEVVIDLQK